MTNSAKLKLTESEFKRIAASIKEEIYNKVHNGNGMDLASIFFDDAGDEREQLLDLFLPNPLTEDKEEEEGKVFTIITQELCEDLYRARLAVRAFYYELNHYVADFEEPVEPKDLGLVIENGEVTL